MGVLGLSFAVVRLANQQHARQQIDSDLHAGALVFERLMRLRLEQLTLGASLMSDDWAFRRLFGGTEDFEDPLERRTLLSGLENYRLRMRDAAFLALVSLDEEWLMDTRFPAEEPLDNFPHSELILEAEVSDTLTASAFEWMDGEPFILFVVPILLPEPSGWIVVGFRVDDALAKDFEALTELEISFVREGDQGVEITASTLPEPLRTEMASGLSVESERREKSAATLFDVETKTENWLSLWSPLPGAGERAKALLQRGLSAEMAPYEQLERTLLVLTVLSLALSALLAVWLAKGISRPVDDLALAAKRIEEGNYQQPVPVQRDDELGRLAQAFNDMAEGLDERDRVRDLLGKAVSPEIATELLRRPLALGGEEREVTVMFTDLRGFTNLSETVSPSVLLELLNEYFTRVTKVIEAHGGIVDKYIGDSVMAVFGAPVELAEHAQQAVRCCRALCDELEAFNEERVSLGLAPFATGIGVATGQVVAGNMGSNSRHNYTVIGDAVNLAARLQDLTKTQRVRCLVAGDTADRCGDAKALLAASGELQVRGKAAAVAVFKLTET